MPSGLFKTGFGIWRRSRVSDGAGGWSETFSLASSVSGRLSPLSASETPRGMQERGVVALRFSTSSATDIKAGDQVRVDGRIVDVEAVRITSTGNRKECLCEEVPDAS